MSGPQNQNMPMTKALFSSAELAKITGGRLVDAGPEGASYSLTTDTRLLAPGQVYVGIKGERFDGSDFFAEALKHDNVGVMGPARAINALDDAQWAGRPRIIVADGTYALGLCGAANRARYPSIPVIGLTGSAGKTTTRTLIQGALAPDYAPVHGTRGNLNNHIGVPLTLLNLGPEHRAAVIEMGMSAPGEIRYLSELAQPSVRLITNVGRAHLDVLKDESGVAMAKGELFDTAKAGDVLILNLDDPRVAALPRPAGVRVVTFGRDQRSQLRLMEGEALQERRSAPVGGSFSCLVDGQEVRCTLRLPGAHNRLNAVAALAVAWSLGVDAKRAADALGEVEAEGMRMAIHHLPNGARVINDAYNANPQSMVAGLQTAAELAGGGDKVVAILGDMLELGPLAEDSHRQVGGAAARVGVAQLMTTGRYGEALMDGALSAGLPAHRGALFGDMDALIQALPRDIPPSTVFFVKGSRGARMERAAQAILGGSYS